MWWCGAVVLCGGFLTDNNTTHTKVVLSCFGLLVGLLQYWFFYFFINISFLLVELDTNLSEDTNKKNIFIFEGNPHWRAKRGWPRWGRIPPPPPCNIERLNWIELKYPYSQIVYAVWWTVRRQAGVISGKDISNYGKIIGKQLVNSEDWGPKFCQFEILR